MALNKKKVHSCFNYSFIHSSFNMKVIKLSDNIIEPIKDFDYRKLNEEQKSLIEKLILNGELRNRCIKSGLCEECKQLNTCSNSGTLTCNWCQSCNSKNFQQDFKNWTSGNYNVDEFIQRTQLEAIKIS